MESNESNGVKELIPVPYEDQMIPRAQDAPIVYGRREKGYAYSRRRPCAFLFDRLIDEI